MVDKIELILEELKMIKEGKQIGYLYHYTSLENLLNILKWDVMRATDGSKVDYGELEKGYFISFTRNKNFHKVNKMFGELGVRITFDGDKLSNRYKIKPNQYMGREKKTSRGRGPGDYTESEERLYGVKEVKQVTKYIVKIEILKSVWHNEVELRKNKDVEYLIWDVIEMDTTDFDDFKKILEAVYGFKVELVNRF